MFKFLKKIFKEEVIKEDVSLEQLEEWFNQKTESYFSDFKEYVKENINEFNSLLEKLTELTKELENAEIENPDKIEDRTRSIVLGHRTNYIRRINLFQRNIELPENNDYDTIIEFLDHLEKELDSFGKDTMKSFQASQHLFHKQTEDLAKTIGKISELREKFIKNLNDSLDLLNKNEELICLKKYNEKIVKCAKNGDEVWETLEEVATNGHY